MNMMFFACRKEAKSHGRRGNKHIIRVPWCKCKIKKSEQSQQSFVKA